MLPLEGTECRPLQTTRRPPKVLLRQQHQKHTESLIRRFTSDFTDPQDSSDNPRTPLKSLVSPRNHGRDFADALDFTVYGFAESLGNPRIH